MASAKKGVHWNFDDVSLSELEGPSDASQSFVSTSSLEYVNSQLIAHGFVDSPGLCLDGLANKDSERVLKCFLSLLGQRMVSSHSTPSLTAPNPEAGGYVPDRANDC